MIGSDQLSVFPPMEAGASADEWFYVRRSRPDRDRPSWTGPLCGRDVADREAKAWNDDTGWDAAVMPATPEVRAEVLAWEQRVERTLRPRRVGPCSCACNSGGFCGGCGHAGCGGQR